MAAQGSPTRRLGSPWFAVFLARRLVWAVVTLLVFITVLFVFIQVWVPYTWADQFRLGGPDAYFAALESAGLDRPLPVRYMEYMGGLLSGDLGTSFSGLDVLDTIRASLPVTLLVFASGALIGWLIGEMLGKVAAWRKGRPVGVLLSVLGVLSATIFPPFLVFLLVRWLRFPLLDLRSAMGLPSDSLELWRPWLSGDPAAVSPGGVLWLVALSLVGAIVAGMAVRAYARRNHSRALALSAIPVMVAAAVVAIGLSGVGDHALDVLYRVDMSTGVGRGSPALALIGMVLITFGQVLFMMRVGVEDESTEDHVLSARGKGLPEREVRDRHVAHNAMGPVLAGSFLALPTVLAGLIIVEWELEMGGLSSLLFGAIESQDIPLIMGVMVVLGVLGIVVRIVTDISIATLDPRQRGGET